MYKDFSNISTIILRNFHLVHIMKTLLGTNTLNAEDDLY